MLTRLEKTFSRHKGKLLAAAAVAVGVVAYFHASSDPTSDADGIGSNVDLTGCETPGNRISKGRSTEAERDVVRDKGSIKKLELMYNQMTQAERFKLIMTSNDQFSKIFPTFLKTLKNTVVSEVDIASVIQQIREIRDSEKIEENLKIETKLHDEIKVCSFCLFITNAFIISISCVLMRVQIHLLAKFFNSLYRFRSDSSSAMGLEADNDQYIFKVVNKKTYETLMGPGMKEAIDNIRQKVANAFRDWNLESKDEVQFNELNNQVSFVRRLVETELDSFIKLVILSKENEALYHAADNMASPDNRNKEEIINQILNQTWDIVESPMFSSAVLGTVDIYFSLAFDKLRTGVFRASLEDARDDRASHISSPARCPGLTSVVPSVKGIADSLFPSPSSQDPSTESRDARIVSSSIAALSSSTELESLCQSVLEATYFQSSRLI